MPKITFDSTINIPTVGSFIAGIVSIVVFIMGLKADIKVHTSELSFLKQEVGELRRIQLKLSVKVDTQETVSQQTAELAETSKRIVDKNTKVLKKITGSTIVNKEKEIPEEIK